MNEMNPETKLFVEYLRQEHEVEANPKDIAWEGIKMYHEEIDTNLLRKEILVTLPDPLLLLTASYVDEDEQEWIFCIVKEVFFLTKWLHAVCLLDGELLDENVSLT